MEYIVLLVLIVVSIVVFKLVFKVSFKELKKISTNKELEKITNKFPENKEIAKEILEIVDNKDVKIEEAKNTKTSLYIAITNKIIIADMKENYGRIQTIAHECIHSCQDRSMLLFNFIFTNINMIYFLLISILTICKVIDNKMLFVSSLFIFMLIQFAFRSYLEIDAMTRSKYLAKEYIEKKNIISKDEEELLLKEYEKINKIGIPFTVFDLLLKGFINIFIYILICIIA